MDIPTSSLVSHWGAKNQHNTKTKRTAILSEANASCFFDHPLNEVLSASFRCCFFPGLFIIRICCVQKKPRPERTAAFSVSIAGSCCYLDFGPWKNKISE